MYKIGDKDSIEKLTDVPIMDVGAPLPIMMRNDSDLVLGYIVSSSSPKPYEKHVEVIKGETGYGRFALIRFWRSIAGVSCLPPEDDIDKHPLSARGLRPYMAVKVNNSSWLHLTKEIYKIEDEKMNHFIFTFHDSSFECLARSYWVTVFEGCTEETLKEHLLKPFFGPFA